MPKFWVVIDFGGNIIDEYVEEAEDQRELEALALERAKDNLGVETGIEEDPDA